MFLLCETVSVEYEKSQNILKIKKEVKSVIVKIQKIVFDNNSVLEEILPAYTAQRIYNIYLCRHIIC